MLARHFPPIGGAGVHRTLGSVRHLPEHGFEPIVVTGAGERHGRWEPRDDGLLAAVPDGVPVHRIGAEPVAATSPVRRMGGLPPPWVQWWVRESARLGREAGAGADVIYASCLPYETAFAAAELARELGVPWVADLEDAWALDEMRVFPSALHRALELRRMRRALASASAVVMAAPEAAARVLAAMPELGGRITVAGVPIGYEPADFDVAPGRTGDGAFRIVHAGSMHTDLGLRLRSTRTRRRLLGGVTPGLDVLPRSHMFLATALALLGDARAQLHLAGGLTAADHAASARYAQVHDHGVLTHRDTVALMRSADLLFLPMHDLPAGVRAGLIPYKTYEYLGARRPILAAVPDGDVRDMLAPLEHAALVRPTDVAGMVDARRARIEGGDQADAEPPRAFERARGAARIAEILRAL